MNQQMNQTTQSRLFGSGPTLGYFDTEMTVETNDF